MVIKLAFRNLFRNLGRTLISLLVIASGGMAIILANGFKDDTIVQLRDATIRELVGHLQIYKRGYLDEAQVHPFDFMIERPDPLITKIETLPHVRSVGPRLAFAGLASNGETSVSFIAQAFDPERETLLQGTHSLLKGKHLSSRESKGVTLGKGLARALRVQPGDSVVLLSPTERGAINALDTPVEGIFQTIDKAFDDRAVRLSVNLGQRLLRMNRVEALVINLDSTVQTDSLKTSLEALLKEWKLDYEVKAWYELDQGKEILKLRDVYDAMFKVLNLIILIVVTFGIMNTMNIIVLERTGEIGTLMALGTSTHRIGALFLAEGVILGVLGGLLGCLGGYIGALLISHIGIPMPSPPGSTGVWIARIATPLHNFIPALLMGIATSIFSSVLPALKASRIEVAEALRHNI